MVSLAANPSGRRNKSLSYQQGPVQSAMIPAASLRSSFGMVKTAICDSVYLGTSTSAFSQ